MIPQPTPSPTPTPPGAPGASPMGAPMGGTGAATSPRPMMGNAANSMAMVHTGLEALQKSLVGLPMGSEIHTAVLKAVTDISKRLNNESGDKSSQLQALAAMSREAQANPQAAAMQRMQQSGGQPQPPAMPG